MKKLFLILAFPLFFSLNNLSAQSSQKLSEYLDVDFLTNAQASYLAAAYKNLIPEDATYSQAFQALKETTPFLNSADENDYITLMDISKIYADAANLRGGLLYRLTKSRRYAFKELKAQGILPETADPSSKVTGRDAIAIFNGCLEKAGE